MQGNNALRSAGFQRACFRIEFHTPDILDLDNVLRSQLANLRNPSSGIGSDPRYPSPNRILFSKRGSENQLCLFVREATFLFTLFAFHIERNAVSWVQWN